MPPPPPASNPGWLSASGCHNPETPAICDPTLTRPIARSPPTIPHHKHHPNAQHKRPPWPNDPTCDRNHGALGSVRRICSATACQSGIASAASAAEAAAAASFGAMGASDPPPPQRREADCRRGGGGGGGAAHESTVAQRGRADKMMNAINAWFRRAPPNE